MNNFSKTAPMRYCKFSELTGYSIAAIRKKVQGAWSNAGFCYKINGDCLIDYEGYKAWVQKQIELQRESGEHLTVATRSHSCTKTRNVASVSKVSPQQPTMQM